MPTRGLNQALEGIKGIGSLAGGACVLWIVYTIAGVMLDDAGKRAPGGYGGIEANNWINTGLDQVLPATFLLLIFFGLVATAVLSRRV